MYTMEYSIIWKNETVQYFKTGNGPALCMIHGFGEDHHIFDRQVEFLKKDFTIILPNIPGTGKSTLSQKKTLSELAACILAILDHEEISTFHLCGHSLGGYIAMELVKQFPDRLSSLILFHSLAFADDEEKLKARDKSMLFIQENGADAFLESTTPNLFFKKELHENEIAKLLASNSCSKETLINYYAAMMERKDNSSLLTTMNCPVLFIIGEYDKAVPLNLSLKQAHLPSLSFVYILKESAHMGMLEESQKCNEILAYFLQEAN